MDQIRVLIADDYEPFRRGVRAMFQSEADITVVGEAADGQGALAEAEALQPDVVLMDLKMPGMDGLEATRRILHTSPHIRVLMLTMADDDESVFAALQVGARGYVLKGALKADVLRAIRGVHSGDAIFGAAVAQRLMHYFATVRPPVTGDAFPDLTERERQILELLAQNLSYLAFADRRVLSVMIVRYHISYICM